MSANREGTQNGTTQERAQRRCHTATAAHNCVVKSTAATPGEDAEPMPAKPEWPAEL